MKNQKKNNHSFLLVILLLLVVGISVGYAALSKNLNINGTSNIAKDASWNVLLQNVKVSAGSVTATTPATISGDTVNFAVNLTTPGDYYEFTVDVKNAGTIDAKLGSEPTLPTLTAEQQKYVTYSIKYADGTAIAANDALTSGTTKTVKVRLEFKKDIASLPADGLSLTLNYAMNYVQQ